MQNTSQLDTTNHLLGEMPYKRCGHLCRRS